MKNTQLPYLGIFNRKVFCALTRGSPVPEKPDSGRHRQPVLIE
jgi:hypothetical protein